MRCEVSTAGLTDTELTLCFCLCRSARQLSVRSGRTMVAAAQTGDIFRFNNHNQAMTRSPHGFTVLKYSSALPDCKFLVFFSGF